MGLLLLNDGAELMGQVLIFALGLHERQLGLGKFELELTDALVGRLELAVAGFCCSFPGQLKLLFLLKSEKKIAA